MTILFKGLKVMKRVGIQKKVLITILITGFIALSIGLFVTYLQVKNILTGAIGRDFAEIAKKTSERFDETVKEEIINFNRLADDHVFIKAVKEQNKNQIESFLEHYLRHAEEREEHLGLFVVNADGNVIGSSKLELNRFPDITFKAVWEKIYNGGDGRIYASDIYVDKETGDRAFEIGVPVKDPATNKVIGGIRSIMKVDSFFRFVKEMSFGKTGHGMLVDSEGTPLICSILPLVSHSINKQLINLITFKGEGWAVVPDDAHGGRNSIIGFSPLVFINSMGPENIGGHRWYTFVRQAPEETFAPVYRLMVQILIIESIIVLFICTLGVYIVRRLIVHPISVLTNGVERVAKGEFDHNINIRTGDELEILADGFNKMRTALKEVYYNLEEKIRERTAAFRASENKYRALMEQANDAILLINPDTGQITEVNLQAEVLTGYSTEEISRIKYWDLFPESIASSARGHFNKGVERGFAIFYDLPVKNKNGDTVLVDLSARLIEFNNGKVFHAVMRDVTDRKKG
ncbi:MAG: cache domain-containing protein [Nitrospira sp.]|nr:cache domain-containing protein [Nitrospira sp.]